MSAVLSYISRLIRRLLRRSRPPPDLSWHRRQRARQAGREYGAELLWWRN